MYAGKSFVAAAVGCLLLTASTCSAETIYGCIKTSTGALRVVSGA